MMRNCSSVLTEPEPGCSILLYSPGQHSDKFEPTMNPNGLPNDRHLGCEKHAGVEGGQLLPVSRNLDYSTRPSMFNDPGAGQLAECG